MLARSQPRSRGGDGGGGGGMRTCLSQSNIVTMADKELPMHVHISLTGVESEMRATWTVAAPQTGEPSRRVVFTQHALPV